MTSNDKRLITSLEGISFIKDLSSRFRIPAKYVIFGMSGLAVGLLLIVLYLVFLHPGSVEESLVVEPGLAFAQLPTEFEDPPDVANDPIPVTTLEPCVVYVTGAVANPGLYTLISGNRIGDAVEAAGGFSSEAAEATVNLAQLIADGMQIHIPCLDDVSQNSPVASAGTIIEATAASTGVTPSALVNINTADSATLQTLTGIGPATAQKIIDYRTAHGPFSTKEELLRVSGIGAKKYAAIEAFITV